MQQSFIRFALHLKSVRVVGCLFVAPHVVYSEAVKWNYQIAPIRRTNNLWKTLVLIVWIYQSRFPMNCDWSIQTPRYERFIGLPVMLWAKNQRGRQCPTCQRWRVWWDRERDSPSKSGQPRTRPERAIEPSQSSNICPGSIWDRLVFSFYNLVVSDFSKKNDTDFSKINDTVYTVPCSLCFQQFSRKFQKSWKHKGHAGNIRGWKYKGCGSVNKLCHKISDLWARFPARKFPRQTVCELCPVKMPLFAIVATSNSGQGCAFHLHFSLFLTIFKFLRLHIYSWVLTHELADA